MALVIQPPPVWHNIMDSQNMKDWLTRVYLRFNELVSTDNTQVLVDGVEVTTDSPTLDFDGTDFVLTEAPADTFDITINTERIADLVGAMVTGNTETGITVTYQDADNTLDFEVSNSFVRTIVTDILG